MSWNYLKWCIVRRDPYLSDFLEPNFPSFPVERFGRKYFRRLIVRAFEHHTCKDFSYLIVFLENYFCYFCLIFHEFSALLENEIFQNFCNGGLVFISLELKWLVLPAIVAYYLRYPVSCIYLKLWNCVEFQRLSRWGDCTSWIRHGAYVIIKLTFCDRNLGTEPCIDCFWLRTAFLAFATNSSGLHSEVVATSDICFWVSSRSKVLASSVRR